MVEARNTVGYSAISAELSILAAQVPDQPSAPTTAVNGYNVDITWSAPFDGSTQITAYTITIRQLDGTTFTQELTNCDGTSQAIVNARKCSVLISDLLGAPYNLPWGSSVYAKVAAINIKGASVFSIEGNGAVILTIPDSPLNLQNNAAVTSATQIGVTWTEGLEDGGSAVLYYKVSYKAQADLSYTEISEIYALAYTITGLTAGINYNIKV